jgi:Ca-activated chloride channel family protein
MKPLLKLFSILVVCFQLQAQQKTITGIVTTINDGLPLPGVTIVVKGTSVGTQTDFAGKYKITAHSGDILVFTYVAMKTSEITVGSNSVINVALEEDVSALEEVVITGYTTTRSRSKSKAELERRAKKIYHNRLANQMNTNTVVNSLSGQMAGVTISKYSGQPGAHSKIVIQGYTSLKGNQEPLVIIDGQVSDYSRLDNFDPNTIKNIEVLKDKNATTLYGNSGNNGVLVITTTNDKVNFDEKILYIVDGIPIKKENNHIVENFSAQQVDSRVEYSKAEAKEKFGKIAKNGCIVITTHHGNFRLENQETYAVINENHFEKTTLSPLSTFSIDVDKAGYSNVRRLINNGEVIAPDAVKIEEMINYFNYNYPQPTDQHPFSINTEVVKTPWHNDTQLVRIGLQGKTYKTEDLPTSNLTFLIDVSGSMSAQNKLPLLKSAFKLLVNQMRKKDKVSIVVYAGAAGVVLEPTAGDKKEKIMSALDNLSAGGSTAGGAGIELAYSLAERHFKKNGNNRVILATDGDFNVGASNDKAMEKLIEEKRKSGVFLSVLGFGYGNYKDSKLEILADKGNGNHAYIDTMQEAQKVFGKEFGGTLYTIAKDVKIQVEFNPKKVQAYRLIGYENRLLNDEDFIDDTIDAGELGSGHTVTALYELIPVGVKSNYIKGVADLKYTNAKLQSNFSDELFTVKFRYKKPEASESIEMVHIQNTTIIEASSDMNFASAVALFGMKLRNSSYCNNATINDVINLAEKGRSDDEDGYRTEFVRLVKSHETLR